MGLHKGNTNNPHGRPKGAQNRLNSELREQISNFLNDNWATIESDFQKLDPEKRFVFFEKLLQYTMPKLKMVENIETESKNSETPIFVFKDLNPEKSHNYGTK